MLFLYLCMCDNTNVMLKKNIANIITLLRIIGTIALLPIKTLSKEYFILHGVVGATDALDGFVARKLKITSAFGSKLDSLSDLLFYSVMLIKISPYLREAFPRYVWVLINTVIGIRTILYILVYIKERTFLSRHTIINKITSFMVFLLPFFIPTKYLLHYSIATVIVAYLSNIDEIIYMFKNKKKMQA